MDPSGGATPVVLGSMNKWTLDLARDRADATCFGDTNKIAAQGLPSVKGDVGGVWNEAESGELFKAAMGDVAVFLKLVPSTLAPTYFFSGLAYLDAGIDVAHDGVITIKGSYEAGGPWTFDPTGP